MINPIKYLTTTDLIELNVVKQRPDTWNKWAKDSAYPIKFHTLLHNDVEVRCQIVMNYDGETCWLDIPLAKFNSLQSIPTHETVADVPRRDAREGF